MSCPPYALRRLAPGDLACLRRLNALFAVAFDDSATYGSAPPDDSYLESLLAKEHIVVLVATQGGDTVLGGLVAYVLEKLEQASREIYIYDLAVAEPHRRRGIASSLIEHLRKIAVARGAAVMFVQADHGDDPAIALYAKLGLRKAVLHFDIAVPPTTTLTTAPVVAPHS